MFSGVSPPANSPHSAGPFPAIGILATVSCLMAEATHSYYDWQVSTLMLAYDAIEPLDRNDSHGLGEREQRVQKELWELATAVLPKEYRENPESEFPPEVVMLLTRATIIRAAQIMKLTRGDWVAGQS